MYRVQLRDAVTEETAAQLRAGILLRGEKQATLPAEIVLIDLNLRNEVLLTIREGKYHQVKRMFAATGNLVTGLHREQVGEIKLDSELNPGEYRQLTPAEVSSVT
jgi:16S rRNA pseudouridine516 synthase